MSKELIRLQLPIALDFLKHYALYEFYHDKEEKNEHEILTSNAHLQMAFIQWCKIFGSDSEETHRKKLEFQSDDFWDDAPISKSDFQQEWEEITNFRNEYVAHYDTFNSPIPSLKNAREIVFHWDRWVRQKMAKEHRHFINAASLKRYEKSFKEKL